MNNMLEFTTPSMEDYENNTTMSGICSWSNYKESTPFEDLKGAIEAIGGELTTTRIICSAEVFEILIRHPDASLKNMLFIERMTKAASWINFVEVFNLESEEKFAIRPLDLLI